MVLLKPLWPKDLRIIPILRIPPYRPRVHHQCSPCRNVIAHHLAPLLLSLPLSNSSSPIIFVIPQPNASLTSLCTFFMMIGLQTSSEIDHSKVVQVVSLPATRIS
ncbi:hypothetical protein IEQ34_016373 [Dendrobium chrysotoxum]|uniref:Uncharacterized protein n=1 Tax=Dendrobium chrysotoxum TaxID=161865 RepID=A0AAV7GEX2_DENCH|nr:hypothetical protein IEQ34_016373 [Dendrobium chrysotoxum]